ncbi:MAG: two pore domain potassium channel family protein [Nitrospira sp.]|nr:two pore domain potassium channel family protein [bacterium]MBL7049196.1 two pore domain potassium channel family protein [Nitrospira sp.]
MSNLINRLRAFLLILVIIITVVTAGFMLFEGLSLPDPFYFSVVTLAAVGYGDITPVTAAGKILSLFLIITGVGIFLGAVAGAAEILIRRQERAERMNPFNTQISALVPGS